MNLSEICTAILKILPFLKRGKMWWLRRKATKTVRKELPGLIKAVEPLMSTSQSCGLYSFVKEGNKVMPEKNFRLEELMHAVNILGDFYKVFFARAQRSLDICLCDLEAMGYLLLGVQRISERVFKLLEEDVLKRFKLDSNAYPVFKKKYEDVALKFHLLTVEVKNTYEDSTEWRQLALPELL